MVYLTKRVEFSAAHCLRLSDLSDEENLDMFGPCANPKGHGHNYVVEITVKGEPDPRTGMFINLRHLKDIIHREVLDHVDHKHLDEDVEFLRGTISTAENLARAIWTRLKPALPAGELHRVRVCETPNNYTDYLGP